MGEMNMLQNKRLLLTLLTLIILLLLAGCNQHKGTDGRYVDTQEEFFDIIFSELKTGESYTTIYTTFDPNDVKLDYTYLNTLAKQEGEYFAENLPRFSYETKKSGRNYKVNVMMGSVFVPSPSKTRLMQELVRKLAKDSKGLSTYEKVKYAHDYIVLHSEDVPAGDDAYLVLCEGKANSRGSSRAFQVIMEEMEIPCKISNYRSTYWNIVKVDGQWYNISCYYDDGENQTVNYGYFLKSNRNWIIPNNNTLVSSSTYNATDLEKRYDYPNFLFWIYFKRVFLIALGIASIIGLITAFRLVGKKRFEQRFASKKNYRDRNTSNEYVSPYDNLD